MPFYLFARLRPLVAVVTVSLLGTAVGGCVQVVAAELDGQGAERLQSTSVTPREAGGPNLSGFDPAAEWAAATAAATWAQAGQPYSRPHAFAAAPPERFPSPSERADAVAQAASSFASAFTEVTAETQFVAGQVAVTANDFLFNGYRRPGAAASIRNNKRSQVTLFSAMADPARRYYGNPALDAAPTEFSSGMRATTRLAPNVEMSAGYIAGETNFLAPDAVLFNEPRRYGGDGWNMVLDSRWLQKSMRVYVEYAQTSFDRDGLGRGAGYRRDNAAQLAVHLGPGPLLGVGPLDYWSSDVRYRSIGSDFFTLANPMLGTDQEALGSWFRFGRGSLAGQLHWLSEGNNLAGRTDRSTRAVERSAMELTYTPMLPPTQAWLWERVGAPALVTELGQIERTRSIPKGARKVGYHPADETAELRTVLRFTRPSWKWSARYHVLDREGLVDRTELPGGALFERPPDQRRELAGFKIGLTPSDRFSFDVSMLWNTFSERAQSEAGAVAEIEDRRHYGMDLTAAIVPDRMSMRLHYHHGRDFDTLGDIGLLSDRTLIENGYLQLSWHALKAGIARPAVDVYLQGQYDRQVNPIVDTTWDNWSVRLGMKLFWRDGS